MSDKLKGKRVAILATDGVEQVELIEPQESPGGSRGAVQTLSLRKTERLRVGTIPIGVKRFPSM